MQDLNRLEKLERDNSIMRQKLRLNQVFLVLVVVSFLILIAILAALRVV